MNPIDFQSWLGSHGQPVVLDGKLGPKTRAALKAAFVNTFASAVTDADIAALATRLGCTTAQLRAVAKVESGGAAYDGNSRPKILFERHKFHSFTGGRFGVSAWSNPQRGGYNEDSWEKLAQAACQDVGAAFASASWGKFQVMGFHWDALGYLSALDLAYSTVTGEAAHYDMLGRFIDRNGLRPAIQRLSKSPEDNRAFARAYNGPRYAEFDYHNKLARALA